MSALQDISTHISIQAHTVYTRCSAFLVCFTSLQGYWEDIGTVEAFYSSNLALADPATAQFRCALACVNS